MHKFLLDENMPNLIPFLEGRGLQGEYFTPGASDKEVWRHAVENGYVLITFDKDFLNQKKFPSIYPIFIFRRGMDQKSYHTTFMKKVINLLDTKDRIEGTFTIRMKDGNVKVGKVS